MTGISLVFLTAVELGLILSIVVLALFLSYTNLNICDLSTDGCFTLGATVGCMVAYFGHPLLAIPAAIAAGMVSGLVTAFLQTKMGINSLLAGIIVNTGLYSINIVVLNNSSIVNLNSKDTIFTIFEGWLENTFLYNFSNVILLVFIVAIVVAFIVTLLKTRLGLAIRATGDNLEMVRSSSINPDRIIIIGLILSNGLTGLAGALLAFSQGYADVNMGSGMVTIALASLLIGYIFFRKGNVTLKAIACIIGAIIFRIIYALALRLNMPATYLKLVSSVIIIIAISAPYLKGQYPIIKRKFLTKFGGNKKC